MSDLNNNEAADVAANSTHSAMYDCGGVTKGGTIRENVFFMFDDGVSVMCVWADVAAILREGMTVRIVTNSGASPISVSFAPADCYEFDPAHEAAEAKALNLWGRLVDGLEAYLKKDSKG